eukprot:11200025-Lingulodinium_polyedra.AAC.1
MAQPHARRGRVGRRQVAGPARGPGGPRAHGPGPLPPAAGRRRGGGAPRPPGPVARRGGGVARRDRRHHRPRACGCPGPPGRVGRTGQGGQVHAGGARFRGRVRGPPRAPGAGLHREGSRGRSPPGHGAWC